MINDIFNFATPIIQGVIILILGLISILGSFLIDIEKERKPTQWTPKVQRGRMLIIGAFCIVLGLVIIIIEM